MSTYKEPVEWVVKCIESVVNQTIKPFEYIIIVDYPDNTEMINMLKEYESKYSFIKVIINEVNMGLVKSLNRALEYCTGDYIARIDADDFAVEDRFEKQLQYLEEKQYDVVGAGYYIFYDDKILEKRYGKPNDKLCKNLLKYCTCIAHPTYFVRKEVYKSLDGYRNIDACEDLDFLIRAALAGYKLGSYPGQLMWYRDNPNSISHKKNSKQAIVKEYLCNQYRKKRCVSMADYERFVDSDEFANKVKSLDDINERQCVKDNLGSVQKLQKKCLLLFNKTFINQKITNQKIKITNKIYG